MIEKRRELGGAPGPIRPDLGRDDMNMRCIKLFQAFLYPEREVGRIDRDDRSRPQPPRRFGDLADAAGGRVIRHQDLLIDLERRRVQRGDRRLSLTATEFEILRHLASRPGRVFSRRELIELVRDYEALDQDEKTINVHVSHLRDKLEDDPTHPAFVQTIRGVGYAFAER